MTEKQFIENLGQLDRLLASASLTRDDHDKVRQVMLAVTERIKLSFQMEKELNKMEEDDAGSSL